MQDELYKVVQIPETLDARNSRGPAEVLGADR